jgi:simple sugar transport system substrate-binding protein
MKEGMVKIAPYNSVVPENVRKAADAVKDGILAGTLHPITGPVKDNKGAVRIQAGVKINDGDLSKMDWYVEGVQS